jgi:hypothetical protein
MRSPKEDRRRQRTPGVGDTPILIVVSSVILAVFVATVVSLAVEAGTGTAALATILLVAIAVTAVGLWGVAMAVRETVNNVPQERAQQQELAQQIECPPAGPKRPVATQSL